MILNWLLALLSSAILVLLFPQANFAWAAPVALTPLIVACAREPRWKWRFGFGYVAGCVYWFGLCNWIQWTLAHHAGVSSVMAWFLFILFCLAKALQMGVFAALAGVMMRSVLAVPGIAALWVVLEWTHRYTGFEWLGLGNAASDMSMPLRLAPFTGVWGISFAFAVISAVIACLILRQPRVRSLWIVVLALAMMVLPEVPAAGPGDRAAILVQPNIDDEATWTPQLVAQTEQQLMLLSLNPSLRRDHPIDFVLWPEMPAPFEESDITFIDRVATTARLSHAGVLTGVIGRASNKQALNSALLVGRDGKVVSRYDKVNLVPFGEFVPWPFGALTRQVSSEAGEFLPGRNVVVSNVDGHRLGTFICYESVFPGFIRRFAASGAEVLLNISNDSWFGKSAARYQHLEIVRMRAAENARWILRATDNGITAVIDPAGRLIRTAQEYAELSARFEFRYRSELTFYTKYGDWFVAVCALLALAVLTNAVLQVHHRL